MQLPNSPHGDQFQLVIAAIQHERLMRYIPAASGRPELAFSYYLWNCKFCESFHLPLHFAEVVCRNAFNKTLIARAGTDWFTNTTFVGLLDDRYRSELAEALRSERAQHGSAMTAHHVVSALTFGFWDHLATKRFERYLWSAGVRRIFPSAPKDTTRQDVQNRIESVRRWRNRIAHHRSIFDKGPMRKHGEALDLIGWVCPDTRSWVAAESQVPKVIPLRPRG